LKDLGDKVDQGEIDKANEAKEKLKKALEGDNLDEIKAASEELTQIVQALSVKLYEQAAQEAQNAGGAAGGEPQGAKGKDNVVDADFEVVDDKK